MVEFQPKYNLRSKSKPTSASQPKKILQRGQYYEPPSEETLLPNSKTKVVSTQESEVEKVETQAQGTETVNKITSSTRAMSNKAVQTNKSKRKDSKVSTKEIDKVIGAFSFENKINKIKIPIPLVELAKKLVYRKQITKAMGVSELEIQSDVLNLEDEKPNITFGPHFEGAKDIISPFYITLNVYDQLLHNCMLDSRASHKVMPKIIMDKLGLQITRPYGYLYSFDSMRVKCMGMIKYLVVTLAQVSVKSILMDVVIADITPKYGLLLFRSWGAKLGGSLQLDMTFATIPIFGGHFTWLYRETRLAYTVSDPQNPNNFPIYIADQDLGNCILSFDDGLDGCPKENDLEREDSSYMTEDLCNADVWKMYFDGASSSEGAGAGVILVAPEGKFVVPFSY
jgi:hypothetical protein